MSIIIYSYMNYKYIIFFKIKFITLFILKYLKLLFMYMDYESYLLYFEISIGITKN